MQYLGCMKLHQTLNKIILIPASLFRHYCFCYILFVSDFTSSLLHHFPRNIILLLSPGTAARYFSIIVLSVTYHTSWLYLINAPPVFLLHTPLYVVLSPHIFLITCSLTPDLTRYSVINLGLGRGQRYRFFEKNSFKITHNFK